MLHFVSLLGKSILNLLFPKTCVESVESTIKHWLKIYLTVVRVILKRRRKKPKSINKIKRNLITIWTLPMKLLNMKRNLQRGKIFMGGNIFLKVPYSRESPLKYWRDCIVCFQLFRSYGNSESIVKVVI